MGQESTQVFLPIAELCTHVRVPVSQSKYPACVSHGPARTPNSAHYLILYHNEGCQLYTLRWQHHHNKVCSLKHKGKVSGGQLMTSRNTTDRKQVYLLLDHFQRRGKLFGATPSPAQSHKNILIFLARLGQSLQGKRQQEKQTRPKRKKKTKQNHSTVQWEITHKFTHAARPEDHMHYP